MRSSEIASTCKARLNCALGCRSHDGARHRRCRALRHSGAAALPPRPPEEPPRRRRSRSRRSRPRSAGAPPVDPRRGRVGPGRGARRRVAWSSLRDRRLRHRRRCRLAGCLRSRRRAPIPGGRVEYSQPGNVTEAYRAVAGPDDGVAARGDAACRARRRRRTRLVAAPRARGRSRSLPVSPRRRRAPRCGGRRPLRACSRTQCATDGDLAALFTWWRGQRDDANAEHP